MLKRFALCGLLVALLAGCLEGRKPTPLVRKGVQRPAPKEAAEQKDTPPPTVEKKEPTLYKRLGGHDAIVKVVDDFVMNVAADENLKESHKKPFKEGDVEGLKKKLVDQIGQATGGPEEYKGKSMKEAHKGLEITNKDFDALLADLDKALDGNKVAEADKKELRAMLEPIRKDVVEKTE